ncbi:hypothetical protein [Rhizohabitans arisaemae]|uniref:hypothetical protein n=1 Tax=Rhizohabitans arisaemae TaxID=2720610 RepID=UPI0024B1AD6A|nr:hypothetical protein [Rhizohabitans arisaemae]
MKRFVLVGVVATVSAALGIGVRARFGGHVAVDEPQYLLTALSIFEDFSLDISDELAERRWEPWAGSSLPVQTEVLADGSEISPHDPLLPLILAVPMGLGGWVAAKATLALLAGVLAALTLWTAERRFGVRSRIAVPGVAIAFASAPLAVYGQQVYPELPAALAVVAAVAVLTAPGPLAIRPVLATLALLTALPWLSVKYVPVAAALAVHALIRVRGHRIALVSGLAVTGAVYLAVHRLVWGGWTVYASGDHFQESGEFGVMGFEPNFVGRATRLVGLLVDRGYGIAAWQPLWLLLLPAAAALLRYGRGRVLLAPLAAGWLTATFLALTMNGYWWPGRQLVVVLPLALLAVLWFVDHFRPWRPWLPWVALTAGLSGTAAYAWLLADGFARRITWVSGFEDVGYPIYRLLRPILPDYRSGWSGFWALHLLWIGLSLLLIWYGRRVSAVLNRKEPGKCEKSPSLSSPSSAR